MEERREMNGQRMMTREELEMRLPALNHIAEQRDAKFRLRYAEKTLNNGIERGYTLDAGTRVSVNVYQNERWAQMPDEELFDTLNDLDGRYCVTEDQETIGERLNAFFKSGELVNGVKFFSQELLYFSNGRSASITERACKISQFIKNANPELSDEIIAGWMGLPPTVLETMKRDQLRNDQVSEQDE